MWASNVLLDVGILEPRLTHSRNFVLTYSPLLAFVHAPNFGSDSICVQFSASVKVSDSGATDVTKMRPPISAS